MSQYEIAVTLSPSLVSDHLIIKLYELTGHGESMYVDSFKVQL